MSSYSKNLSCWGLEITGDHVCTLIQKILRASKTTFAKGQSAGTSAFYEAIGVKFIARVCHAHTVKRQDWPKNNSILFIIPWGQPSLSFFVFGTSFDMGIIMDKCSLQTHLLMCFLSGRGTVKHSWWWYTLKTVGWGGRRHCHGEMKNKKNKWKDADRWVRYPSGIILALWFGNGIHFWNKSNLSKGSVGVICGICDTAVKFNGSTLTCFVFTKFHKMLLTPLNPI